MINLFIANTENSWFDFLSAEGNLAEVNFWSPGELGFKALQPGELLVFRLKSPRNKVGGFGVFSSYSSLPIQMAWETFGKANGVPSVEALRNTIARLRPHVSVAPSTNIGATVLVEPVFLPEHLWFDLPRSWSSSIQRGKRYSTEDVEGRHIWDHLLDSARLATTTNVAGFPSHEQTRFGAPTLITPRLGQGAFRVAVTEAYGRQCAITNGKVLPALDAAHIKPYSEGGHHAKSNGILLRKDIHSVFDAGYVTITEDLTFAVSNQVKEIFNNGEEYLRLHGRSMRLPDSIVDRPDLDLLRWHNRERYLG